MVAKVRDISAAKADGESSPKRVHASAPIQLALLLDPVEGGWRARIGATERELAVDPSVDPALLEEARELGARVVVDASAEPVIVGVLSTRRAVTIDREGCVHAEVERFEIDAREEVLLKTPRAYIRAKAQDVEVYGGQVLTRAREVAKVLAAMIKLN